MDLEDKKFAFEQVNEWVRFCDTKAGVVLGLQGIILTIIFTLTNIPKTDFCPPFIVFLIGVICLGVSILIGVNAIVPILEVGQPVSGIFFGHISSHKNAEDYLKVIEDASYKFEKDLVMQTWANSRVAWKKFTLIRSSIIWGSIGLVSISVSYLLK